MDDADLEEDGKGFDEDVGASASPLAGTTDGTVSQDMLPDAMKLLDGTLPCTIRFMDFAILEVKSSYKRFPMLMLIRDEWRLLMNMPFGEAEGLDGSVIITGQPGIGEQGLPHS
jgi:hypothetical protein